MKIAYQHLLNFFTEKPSIEDLSNHLFQLGHEHEIDNDIFNMEFTPNRGDCLSLLGLARDLNVFYGANLELDIYQDDIPPLELDFINYEEEKCPNICFLKLEIQNIPLEYKSYLNNYFNDLKLNKNNFFTDVSNYVAYEMGQPTHSYDAKKVDGKIILKNNDSNSDFETLLGKKIKLDGPDLVFTNQDKIINLAGIMGSLDTSCSKNTKTALIECAYFLPNAILGKSIKYDLNSDASHKFERGVDPTSHEKVLRRFINIIQDHVEIVNIEIYRHNNNKFNEKNLELNVNNINKILGINISEIDYISYLKKLGFSISNNNISVPFYRSDIFHQNDLAEEVARVIGYDNISTKDLIIPDVTESAEKSNDKKIRAFLISNGFSEVINSPFCGAENIRSIKVDNPLDSNRKYIRTNLVDSLIENLTYNERRQKDSIKLFEISDVYTKSQNDSIDNITKEKRLALIISGRQGLNYRDFSKKLDQNYLLSIFKNINIEIADNIIIVDRKKLNSKIKTPIFAIEINIDKVDFSFSNQDLNEIILDNSIQYKPISEYPSSYRDFSFSISDYSVLHNVIAKIDESKADHLTNFYMFDFFEDKKIKKIKIGYRFIFQSSERTLTDSEIEDSIRQILQPIISIDSVTIPGIN